jgi:hypothetical protein
LILTDGVLRIGGDALEEFSSSDLNSNVFSASNERSVVSIVDVASGLGDSSGFVMDVFGGRPG